MRTWMWWLLGVGCAESEATCPRDTGGGVDGDPMELEVEGIWTAICQAAKPEFSPGPVQVDLAMVEAPEGLVGIARWVEDPLGDPDDQEAEAFELAATLDPAAALSVDLAAEGRLRWLLDGVVRGARYEATLSEPVVSRKGTTNALRYTCSFERR